MDRRTTVRLLIPGLVMAAIAMLALIVPILPLPDPVTMDVAARLLAPAAGHPLGQDEYGRDVLSRILWGARASLTVGFAAAAAAALAGTALGVLGGYFRGATEFLTMRSAEAILCFPPLLLALLVVTLMGPGVVTLMIVLAVLFAPGFARVAFAETLSTRALDFVTAQHALGATAPRILARTILPNIAPALIVQFSLTVASAIVLESGLSFLGLGVVPPAPSWGLMIRAARSTMEQAPWLLLWPCLALTGTVVALNLLCDTLRDVLDPRGRARVAPWRPVRQDHAPPTTASGRLAHKPPLLAVDGLTVEFSAPSGPVALVRDVALTLAPGETLALVGESGSGKTMTMLALLGLLPPGSRVVAGTARFADRGGPVRDLLGLPEADLRRLRGDAIAVVFQDPGSSLNPVHRAGYMVAETIRAHRPVPRAAARAQAINLLGDVGLADAARRARAFPHELSGGQRQRVTIAGAIANHPRLLIADEPTTALDVTVQAQILNLLATLKARGSLMGMIFVTHNLAVVSEIADRVCVMYAGEIVEQGPVAEVFARPRHPYTAALLASVPEGDAERLTAIPGMVPPAGALPDGCAFAPRCDRAVAECAAARPRLQPTTPTGASRCIKWNEFG